MNLEDMAPKRAPFKMMINGRKKRLFLRPFTLRDQVYIRDRWGEQDLIIKLVNMDIKTICQLVWHMLEPDSKKVLYNVPLVIKDVDDQGQEIDIIPEGYERFLALADAKAIANGLKAFYESRGLNDAIVSDELKKISGDVKKK